MLSAQKYETHVRLILSAAWSTGKKITHIEKILFTRDGRVIILLKGTYVSYRLNPILCRTKGLRPKGSRTGHSVKVSLWCVTLSINTRFCFFFFFNFRISNC